MTRVYYDFTNESLKELLTDLLSQPDFLRVSRRDIVSSFLCAHLHSFGYVAMTHEELIIRNHYDFLGSEKPRARERDMFYHVNLFMQMGIVPARQELARFTVKQVVSRMVEIGILVPTSRGTSLADTNLSIEEAVGELRRRLK